ncbi:PIN domain-containing protein [Aerosakkonemataceae cyanobacterium BLCC-F154]|uniref:PIN domain-containing protein n=1 Tax=Floridaenema fluviatile BLCC-F154 TaxID=3153640 RepID=A0ABV4YD63_9CYAN
MATTPPIAILLDLSSIVGSSIREWQEYSRIGNCYLPQIIYEEIEFLTGRAPEPEVEKTAREFTRFFPESGWQLTNAHAVHPTLNPAAGKDLSKQARLVISVAQCMYGFAQENPDKLVVFVSNSQPILQRIPALKTPNLCGITRAALLQWVRTNQQPPAVTQQLQTFNNSPISGETSQPQPLPKIPAKPTASPPNSPVMTGPASAAQTPTKTRPSSSGLLTKIVSSLITLIILAVLGLTAWRFIQPQSFNQFWRQTGLPALPGQ